MNNTTEEENFYDSSQDDSHSSSGSSLQPWISWFCSLTGHEYYLEVPEDFIDDEFNLTGLSSIVPFYTQALELILDMESGELFDDEDEGDEEDKEDEDDFWNEKDKTPKKLKAPDQSIIEHHAFMLYGLIHQRYLMTREGQKIMAERYANAQFGVCPRYYCYQSPVLPVGQYDEPNRESVYLYCPQCLDIYRPPISNNKCIDGAHFGTTYAHLLFLTNPELVPTTNPPVYEARIYGFKVSPKSKTGPRNQWLRLKPPRETEEEEEEEDF
ncbi:casein kinase II regulatory subunit-domain-containing protein [Gilbertella persicaria]|uniref:casein kinase II regulatory subunit-domain-containing protein n=1 Tax=Gilbertella persicaria TaxID=101096 RepID=UPI00221F8AD3|nr:casein kinase II regulatory subunit-domain-containing protein [Gilbertella persicaria]KAI8083270.1 casein kinase II regulatory subunit-domain-containing protein [Gilbertella persicaria]